MPFNYFIQLPAEIRLFIWETCYQNACAAIISLDKDYLFSSTDRLSPMCQVTKKTGCLAIAMVCRESFTEWQRISTLLWDSPPVRLYIPRTIFLLPSWAELRARSISKPPLCQLAATGIQHLAFFVTSAVKLIDVLSHLSSLDCLKSISIILAECHHEIDDIGSQCRKNQTAEYLDLLTEGLLSGTNLEVSNPIGLSLESDKLDPKVEAFYTGIDAPQLNVVVPPCCRDCYSEETSHVSSRGFWLFEYT
jgi:hypothetical protein